MDDDDLDLDALLDDAADDLLAEAAAQSMAMGGDAGDMDIDDLLDEALDETLKQVAAPPPPRAPRPTAPVVVAPLVSRERMEEGNRMMPYQMVGLARYRVWRRPCAPCYQKTRQRNGSPRSPVMPRCHYLLRLD
jgi:hypothetical protein